MKQGGWAEHSPSKRFQQLLAEIKPDGKGRYKTTDVMRLLRRECELVEMLTKGKKP